MNKATSQQQREFDELRRLLVGPELEKLEQLAQHLESPEQFSSDVGEILPQAMLKSAQQGEQLSKAMVPTVEEIVRLSIKRDINKFADALFPVIGPAIRKSISETFRQMLQSLNQALDNSLSWQGIKWRIESMRTGIPFAEIVLLNGLIFRVEQVFLIHRESSILLKHVERHDSQHQNPDLVSSMLSAIVDFVGDSFEVDADQALDSIQVGEVSIWIERGPDIILALAIRGDAPNSLRATMQQTLEQIQSRFQQSLTQFDGDITAFETSDTLLMDCMQSKYKKDPKKLSLQTLLLALVALILLAYWILYSVYTSKLQQDYIDLLHNEPGYVITRVENNGDRMRINGLIDPLARKPDDLLALTTLDPQHVEHRFVPYQSLTTEFVHKRLIRMIDAPDNVSMHYLHDTFFIQGYASEAWINDLHARLAMFTGLAQVDSSQLSSHVDLSALSAPDSVELTLNKDSGHLVVAGEATHDWAAQARKTVTTIDGVRSYDDSGLTASLDLALFNAPEGVRLSWDKGVLKAYGRAENGWILSLKELAGQYKEAETTDLSQLTNIDEERFLLDINALQEQMIFFASATSFNFESNHALEKATQLVRDIIKRAKILSQTIRIVVQGYSDSVGTYEDNVYLSLERADFVAQYLFNSGISPEYILIKGLEAPVKEESSIAEQNYNRRVTFKVLFN